MHLKFKIMSLTCIFHVSDVVLTVYLVLACKKLNLGEVLLFHIDLPLLKHFIDKNRYSKILIVNE